jgi:hypothetical protein
MFTHTKDDIAAPNFRLINVDGRNFSLLGRLPKKKTDSSAKQVIRPCRQGGSHFGDIPNAAKIGKRDNKRKTPLGLAESLHSFILAPAFAHCCHESFVVPA